MFYNHKQAKYKAQLTDQGRQWNDKSQLLMFTYYVNLVYYYTEEKRLLIIMQIKVYVDKAAVNLF